MIHLLLGLLICAILGPTIYSSGGISLLDYVLTDTYTFSGTLPIVHTFLAGLVYIGGYIFASWAFYILVLVLGGYLGVYTARIVYTIYCSQVGGEKGSTWTECIGMVYMLTNPFMYERMLTQPTIAMGLVLLGWGTYMLAIGYTGKIKSIYTIFGAGICLALAWATFPHAIFLIGTILLVYICIGNAYTYIRILHTIYILCICILLNANWILGPYILGGNNIVGSIGAFGTADILAFATRAVYPLEPFGTTLLLAGFWGEGQMYMQPPVFFSPFWYIAGLLWVCISLYGLYVCGLNRYQKYILLATYIVAACISTGVSTPVTGYFIGILYEYVPFFTGFRESAKWSMILVILYMYAGLYGVVHIADMYMQDVVYTHRKYYTAGVCVLCTVLLYIWSPGVYGGYRGQLRTTTYPAEFSTLRTSLLDTPEKPNILLLPWHSYIACSWTDGRVIANPIRDILSPVRTISADNIEMRDILYSHSTDIRSIDIEKFLSTQDYTYIAKYDYTHILTAKKCADWTTYDWVQDIPQCSVVAENELYVLRKCGM